MLEHRAPAVTSENVAHVHEMNDSGKTFETGYSSTVCETASVKKSVKTTLHLRITTAVGPYFHLTHLHTQSYGIGNALIFQRLISSQHKDIQCILLKRKLCHQHVKIVS